MVYDFPYRKNMKTIWPVITILSFIGILLASYLFFSFLNPETSKLCHISATINCEAITRGDISTFLGIPVSVIGGLGYVFILLSSIYRWKRILLGMTLFGMIFCLRLTILEIFFIKVICPVCLLCQTIMAILVIIAIYLNKTKSSSVTV